MNYIDALRDLEYRYERELQNLEKEHQRKRQEILKTYKEKNQKYPIGYTFTYKGEQAEITGCFVELIEPDTLYIRYSCYVPSWCDVNIDGVGVLGKKENIGLSVLQVEIDRILEQ